jgi:hypothetical protein
MYRQTGIRRYSHMTDNNRNTSYERAIKIEAPHSVQGMLKEYEHIEDLHGKKGVTGAVKMLKNRRFKIADLAGMQR